MAARSADPGGARRLLAVFAHPDDEAFAVGGTIALAAAAGTEITVVCATNGEGGSSLAGPTATELAGQRCQELAAACRALGAGPPELLGLPDGRLGQLDPRPTSDRLLSLIIRRRPQVVLTMGYDGAYGHTDHLALTRLLDQAMARLPPEEQPRLLHTAFPRRLLLPVWRNLRRVTGVIDPEVTGDSLGTTRDRVDLRVDISSVRDQKLAAIACHQSQLRAGDPRSFLRPGLIEALLNEEWYCCTGGPPLPVGAGDPFAGLHLAPQP